MPADPHQKRHTTIFKAQASVYRPSEAEANEARASLDSLRGLFPSDIDPENDPAIIYIVGNLAVPGLLNLNDDAVSIEDGLRIYKRFERQQCNIEHNRGNIVGYIVKAGLSELGTNRLITEAEARAANKPYNIVTVAAIWRVADKNLAAFIMESSAPGSPDKDALSLSFEVGFDDYNVLVLPRSETNLARAKKVVTPSDEAFARWDRMLRVNKGTGLTREGDRVGRVLVGDIIPLGQGIVTVPAAAVKGITVVDRDPNQPTFDDVDAGANGYQFSSTQLTFTEADAVPFQGFAREIPDEDLYTEEADGGRELSPHVTALYGIKGIDPAPVQACLASTGPVTIRLGKITAFENSDRPYDVLKVDVESEALHQMHAAIKRTTSNEDKWPTYFPHLTLAYVKPGVAARYVGDARFEGREYTFNSVTWSPHTGERMEIPLRNDLATPPTQSLAAQVYSESDLDSDDDLMASSPSRYIKLSAGWQERLATLQKDGAVATVTITLSDGRKIANAKVLDVATVESPDEIGLAGVVITDMTPGVGPTIADTPIVHPNIDKVYPNVSPEASAKEKEEEAKRVAATTSGYQGKSAEQIASQGTTTTQTIEALASVDRAFANIIAKATAAIASVSSSTQPTTTPSTSPMKLEDLKQAIAAVKSPEELPAVMANVAQFADIIAKASEQHAQAAKDAQAAKAAVETNLSEVKAQLESLQKSHNEIVAAQAAAAAQAQFDSRMTAIAEVFTFDDETRADIIDEVKACADDAAFSKWMTRAKRLYKAYAKTAVAEFPPKKDEDEKKEKEDDESCAALAAKTALASAKANGVDAPIVVVSAPTTKSLVDTYKEIFARGISINGRSVAETVTK